VRAVSIVTAAKSLLGRKGRGLLAEQQRAADRVWLPADGSKVTDIARVKIAVPVAVGPSLEAHCPPIGDQGATSSCVGEMAHALIAIVESVYGLPYDPPSPRAAYLQSVMTHTERGAKPVDDGTYIRTCLSEIRAKGVATLAEWPRSALNVLKPVPSPLRAHGYNRRGLSYEFIRPLSIEQEMEMTDAAIALMRPVGFGWAVTERYMAYRGTAPYDARVRKSDVIVGGHAQVQISARDPLGVVRFRNSWGTRWADGGNVNVIADTVTRRDLVVVSGWERLVKHA
jgi:hypothetical protein